jgi:hypothetical protein
VLRGRPELARRIQDVNAVILQRAAEEQTIGVYAVHGGRLAEPFFMRFAEIASQPRSAEQIFRDHLENSALRNHTGNLSAEIERAKGTEERFPTPASTGFGMTGRDDLSEHLWLVARWYYSNPREGEIFFRQKDWPYRRILRACARLLTPREPSPKS